MSGSRLILGEDRRWSILAILCSGLMLTGLDNTILTVALPTLAEFFHAGSSSLQWTFDAYSLAFAGLLLPAGGLSDRYGRKLSLLVGLVGFGVASLLCAISQTSGQLIGSRALLGVAAAFVMPATLSILTAVFVDPVERGRAIGIWASTAAIGVVVGPLLGGWLLGHFWWGSVFAVNLPIVVISLALVWLFVPESRNPAQSPTDVVGAVLSIIGLVALTWTIIEAPHNGWLSRTTGLSVLASLAVLVAFVRWELRTQHPMLDVRYFKNPRFSAGAGAITICFFTLFGSLFLVTQLMQFLLGFSTLAVGAGVLPFAAGLAVGAPGSPRLAERFGTRAVVVGGFCMMAVGMLLGGQLHVGSGYGLVGVSLFIVAVGQGLVMAPATEAVMGSVPVAHAGVASATTDATRQVGGALGVAVFGSITASIYVSRVTDYLGSTGHSNLQGAATKSLGATLSSAQRLGGAAGAALADAGRHAFVDAYTGAMFVATGVTLLGAVLLYFTMPSKSADRQEPVVVAEPDDSGHGDTLSCEPNSRSAGRT